MGAVTAAARRGREQPLLPLGLGPLAAQAAAAAAAAALRLPTSALSVWTAHRILWSRHVLLCGALPRLCAALMAARSPSARLLRPLSALRPSVLLGLPLPLAQHLQCVPTLQGGGDKRKCHPDLREVE